jgi:hypothetical protein
VDSYRGGIAFATRAGAVAGHSDATRGEATMIMFLVILLVLLWLLGMVTTTTLGGALHILLVIAIIFLLIGVIRGARV